MATHHEQEQEPFMQLEALPPNAFQIIVCNIPDPSALACSGRAMATLLDQDSLLLAWAAIWAPGLAVANDPQADLRHPGYMLLHWRRLHTMELQRTASLLLQWVAHNNSQAAYVQPTPAAQAAQQLLDAGEPIVALKALLPSSEQLLLLYEAQAGHPALLQHLLAEPAGAQPVRLAWRDDVYGEAQLVWPALLAGIRGGHVDCMHALLSAEARMSGTQPATQEVLKQLLVAAIDGGTRSAQCALALLDMLGATVDGPWAEHMLEVAATTGNVAVAGALLAMGPASEEARREAYTAALHHNQLHLLGMLRPASMDDIEAAQLLCDAPMNCHVALCPPIWHLIPEAMLRLRGTARHKQFWDSAIFAAVVGGRAAPLADMWAVFAAPEDRAALLPCLWQVVGRVAFHLTHDIASWAVSNLVPMGSVSEVVGIQHAKAVTLSALRSGHPALLSALQDEDITAAHIANDFRWKEAHYEGQLFAAVCSGNAAALASLLQRVGEEDVVDGLVSQLFNAAAQLPDADMAVAVVTALAPHVTDAEQVSHSWRLLFHDGRVLKALCSASGVMRSAVVDASYGAEIGAAACAEGDVDMAEWLVIRPGQYATYVCDVFAVICASQAQQAVQLRTFTRLLHRLAAGHTVKQAANNREGPEGSSCGAEEAGGGSIQPGDIERRAHGAMQLTSHFLQLVLELGRPDLLYSVQVFLSAM